MLFSSYKSKGTKTYKMVAMFTHLMEMSPMLQYNYAVQYMLRLKCEILFIFLVPKFVVVIRIFKQVHLN